jgi:hypothetical protein
MATQTNNTAAAVNTAANKTADALSKRAKAAMAKANKTRQAALSAKVKADKAAKAEKAAAAKAASEAKAEALKLASLPLHVLRMESASSASTAYGAARRYAYKLTLTFGQGWAEMPLSGPCSDNEKGLRSAIKEEKASYFEVCKSRKHSNPSVAWAQVVKHAKDAAPGERVTRGPLTKIGDGLKSVYKVLYQNCEVCTQEQQSALDDVRRALAKFGIDYTKLEA